MSRDVPPGAEHDEPDGPPGDREDGLRPTPVTTVIGWAAVGLLGGSLVRPVVDRLGGVPPLVTLPQGLALALLAAILGYVAWVTHRAVHVRRERLEPHQAVNRFVAGRASTLVAALATGGYLGYAIAWIGDPAEQADERLVGSLVAAGCALVAVVAGLLLERACRVHRDD